jgi:hypothetical protein
MRAKKEIHYEHKPSTKEYLIALSSYPTFMKLLEPQNKPYKPLFDWVIKNEPYLLNDDKPFPSVKEISKKLEIPSTKITNHIKTIYNEIHELNEKSPEYFKKEGQKLCFLSFNYLNQYVHFNLGLDVIPRIGDTFYFEFIKPINGGNTFYVDDIAHSIERDGHEVRIYMTYQYPITYLKLLKEKAYLHKDIAFDELLSLSNHTFDEKLIKMHKTL